MASKTLLFAALLLALVAAPATSAKPRVLGFGNLVINGTVHCSVGPTTATTAVFPNAQVQLQCGSNVVSTATTDSDGVFSMSQGFVTSLLSTILSDCKLVVPTPLSTCDASLPAGGLLQSGLQLLGGGGLLGGLLGGIIGLITNLVPLGFNLVQ